MERTKRKSSVYNDCVPYGGRVPNFKEKEGGREEMSEIVERYGDERALMANITSVQNLMNNMKWTLDQALDALGIKGKERTLITQQLQK